jgi:FkbM family methyltransferase
VSPITGASFKTFDFVQDTKLEQWRAATALTKEPGTIAWLDELQPGDVFYDIGANIGIYTIYAAEKVGPTGHVYAVEPHLANAVSLLKNIAVNGYQDRVTVVTAPMSNWQGAVEFYYRDLTAGASGSQVWRARGEDGQAFSPVAKELKVATTLNSLRTVARHPTAIKIDVDGHEAQILNGATRIKPQSWQVEVHPQDADRIADWFAEESYTKASTHYTSNGQKQIAAGADPSTVTANVIYRRSA